MSVDPVTTEVIASRLREIAFTMEHVLYHSGYSPILRESKDGSSGLTDAAGRVILIGGGIQFHFTSYQQAVRGVLARYPAETLKPGESFIVNDPYKGGNSHVPDMVAVTPGFHDGVLIGFGVSIAHKADVGGLVPGSSGAASREIYHDGLLLPPVRFQTDDGVDEAIEAIIANNSRVPDIVLGDLRAQVGSTRIGVERLAALCDEYGRETVREVIATLLALTTRRVKAEIATWPDGEVEAEGFLDHDGADKESPVRVRLRAIKTGERLVLDFTGSSPQTAGPINLIAPTTEAVSLLALLTIADPTIPVNYGLREAIEFVIPEGLVVNPQSPATVNNYIPTAHVVYNCVLTALGQLNQTRAVAPSGLGQGAVSIGFPRTPGGKAAVLYELMSIGLGGTPRNDGAAMVHAITHFTPGAPIEIVESEYPLRVRRFDIRPDSAGAGRHRGGIGYVRELEVLADGVLTVRASNHRFPAWGHGGGLGPKAARVVVNPGTSREESMEPLETRPLKAGDVVRFERSGGGGFGPPEERLADAVHEDVRNGYVSAEAAAEIYRRPQDKV